MSNKPALIKDHPLPNCFSPELLMISRGDGVWLEDASGRRYLDFTGGIAVNALGYGREDMADIAYRQMKKLVHISNLYITEPALELATKMIARGVREARGAGEAGPGSCARQGGAVPDSAPRPRRRCWCRRTAGPCRPWNRR